MSKKLKHIIYILLLAATFPVAMTAAPSATESADSAYAKGDYLKAITILSEQADKEGVSSELFYNLGNAYSKAGNPGASVLNYMKALKLDPSNSEAANNLKYMRMLVQESNESSVGDKTIDPAPESPSFFSSIKSGISSLSSDTWSIISIAIFFLAIAAVVVYLFIKNVKIRKIGFFGGGILLLFSVLAYLFAIVSRSTALDRLEAVIMDNNVILHSSADAKSKEVAAPLNAGTVVKVVAVKAAQDNEPAWTQVYLNADYAGWVPSSSLAIVEVSEIK